MRFRVTIEPSPKPTPYALPSLAVPEYRWTRKEGVLSIVKTLQVMIASYQVASLHCSLVMPYQSDGVTNSEKRMSLG